MRLPRSGDSRPDSDFDVAVFIRDFEGFDDEGSRLADIGMDITLDTGVVINAQPFREGAYPERTGLMAR